MTTGTVPNIMASFRCELQDVMTALLDTTVVQILKLVQKDFLDQLKEKEQEIHGLHTKLQRMAGLPQAEVEEEMQAEAEKETVEEQTGTAVEQHNRETESNLSTDEPLIRQELAGNERNMKKDLEIIQLIEVVNAESLVEAAGAERITETESETFQSDIGAAVQFTDGGGQDGHENQREEKGQKAKRKGKRVRVKSENEDCDDLITEKMSSRIDEVVVLKLEDPAEVEQSEVG